MTAKKNKTQNGNEKFEWKKGDVQIYKSLDDYKKKNPDKKIVKAKKG